MRFLFLGVALLFSGCFSRDAIPCKPAEGECLNLNNCSRCDSFNPDVFADDAVNVSGDYTRAKVRLTSANNTLLATVGQNHRRYGA